MTLTSEILRKLKPTQYTAKTDQTTKSGLNNRHSNMQHNRRHLHTTTKIIVYVVIIIYISVYITTFPSTKMWIIIGMSLVYIVLSSVFKNENACCNK